MADYGLAYDGSIYMVAPTLGNTLSFDTLDIISDYVLIDATAGFQYIYTQAAQFTTTRELALFVNSSANVGVYIGGGSQQSLDSAINLFGSTTIEGKLQFSVDYINSQVRIYHDDVEVSGSPFSITVGGSRNNGVGFRIGGRASSTSGTGTATKLAAGSIVGNTQVIIDGALVRNYVSDGTGNTWEDIEGAQTADLFLSPGDDSQWILLGGGGGAQILVPSSITSEEAFGNLSVVNLLSQIFPSTIDSEEAFGTPTVSSLTSFIFPSTIDSEEAFGQPVITGLVAAIVPIGIPSEETFGGPNVKLLLSYINPTGIPSEEQFGVAEVVLQTQIILPEGILSQEAFGQPLVFDGEYAVIPVGNRRTLRQVAEYLRTQGYSGSVNDVIYTWLAHQSYDGNLNDKLFGYLKDQGFPNSLQDKWKEWENA